MKVKHKIKTIKSTWPGSILVTTLILLMIIMKSYELLIEWTMKKELVCSIVNLRK